MEKIFEIRSYSLSLLFRRFLQRNRFQNFSKSPRFSGNDGERHPGVCMHTHKPASLTSFDPVMVDIQKYWSGTCNQRADSYLTLSCAELSELIQGIRDLLIRVVYNSRV